MSSPLSTTSQAVDDWFAAGGPSALTRSDGSTLADVLERVLDKGVVIAGDISISLVDIELLTIRLRLLIASVDKAREMGINWWEADPWLTATAARNELDQRNAAQDGEAPVGSPERLDRLEEAVQHLAAVLERSEATAGERDSQRNG